jgi:hypothetical protein
MDVVRLCLTALLVGGCIDYEIDPNETDEDAPLDTGADDGVDGDDNLPPEPTGLGMVSGRICAPNNAAWVGGAEVWIETELALYKTLTDAGGHFLLEELPPGVHLVRVHKGHFDTEMWVEVFADFETKLAEDECLSGDVEVAVVTGIFDSIQTILDRFALDYDLIDGVDTTDHVAFLRDPEAMARYDLIFLNCGMTDEAWTPYADEVGANVRDFLAGGGAIYVSDMSYFVFATAFPDAADWADEDGELYASNVLLGPVELQAHITDGNLSVTMGTDTLPVVYEAEGLYAVSAQTYTARPLITASNFRFYSWYEEYGGTMSGQLGIRQDYGGGSIVFTSFHNVYQEPSSLDPLLEQIVLSL